MNKQFNLLILILTIGSLSGFAQVKPDWTVDVYGFFDNQEYKNEHRIPQTMTGIWARPELGLTWNKSHRFVAGVGTLLEFGSNPVSVVPSIYYRYSENTFNFTMGVFSRDKLMGEFPSALISDSIRYYRPNIQGVLFQYGKVNNYIEAYLDWTTRQTETRREQFIVGLSGMYSWDILFTGLQGYYYHYAKTKNAPSTMSINDYGIWNPFVGVNLSSRTGLDSLVFKAGALIGLERNRAEDIWHYPAGVFLEFKLGWKRFLIEDTFYAGKGQQYFGDKGAGEYYWNDAFYRDNLYNRLDVYYYFIKGRLVEAKVGATFHTDGGEFDWQQKLILKMNLGGDFNKKKNKHKQLNGE